MAHGTLRLAAITGQHDAVLYLVLVFLEHTEEGVKANVLRARAVPEYVLLPARQVVVRREYREPERVGPAAEFVLPLSHLFAAPAYDGAVVHTLRRIRYDKVFVDADDAAEALAPRARPQRRVERKHIVVGLFEGDAVGFEAGRENVQGAGGIEAEHTLAVALVERRFDGVRQACHGIRRVVHRHAVDEKPRSVGLFGVQKVFHAHDFAIHVEA